MVSRWHVGHLERNRLKLIDRLRMARWTPPDYWQIHNSNGLVMAIRNYHWLNSTSRVLRSTCSAPPVPTGERKQFSLFDLDLWPATLTYNPRLAKVKVDPHAINQGQMSNGSNRRAPTDKRTHTHTDATKRIIAAATRSINIRLSWVHCILIIIIIIIIQHLYSAIVSYVGFRGACGAS